MEKCKTLKAIKFLYDIKVYLGNQHMNERFFQNN